MSITIFDQVVLVIPILSLLIAVVKLMLTGLGEQSNNQRPLNRPSEMKTDAQRNSLLYRLFS